MSIPFIPPFPLEHIIRRFSVLREGSPSQAANQAAIEVGVSLGYKPRDGQGNVLLSPVGTELWVELAAKQFAASYEDIGGFLVEINTPGSLYAFSLPSQLTSLFAVDALIAGPIESMTRWMLDTGRWTF